MFSCSCRQQRLQRAPESENTAGLYNTAAGGNNGVVRCPCGECKPRVLSYQCRQLADRNTAPPCLDNHSCWCRKSIPPFVRSRGEHQIAARFTRGRESGAGTQLYSTRNRQLPPKGGPGRQGGTYEAQTYAAEAIEARVQASGCVLLQPPPHREPTACVCMSRAGPSKKIGQDSRLRPNFDGVEHSRALNTIVLCRGALSLSYLDLTGGKAKCNFTLSSPSLAARAYMQAYPGVRDFASTEPPNLRRHRRTSLPLARVGHHRRPLRTRRSTHMTRRQSTRPTAVLIGAMSFLGRCRALSTTAGAATAAAVVRPTAAAAAAAAAAAGGGGRRSGMMLGFSSPAAIARRYGTHAARLNVPSSLSLLGSSAPAALSSFAPRPRTRAAGAQAAAAVASPSRRRRRTALGMMVSDRPFRGPQEEAMEEANFSSLGLLGELVDAMDEFGERFFLCWKGGDGCTHVVCAKRLYLPCMWYIAVFGESFGDSGIWFGT